MKTILEFKDLDEQNLEGISIDFDKFKVVDFTDVKEYDIFYNKNKKSISAKDYLENLLDKGVGVHIDGVVYYKHNLFSSNEYGYMNKYREKLRNHINKSILIRKEYVSSIKNYAVDKESELFVKNAVLLYKKGFSLNWIKTRVEGKVHDINLFLENLDGLKEAI